MKLVKEGTDKKECQREKRNNERKRTEKYEKKKKNR